MERYTRYCVKSLLEIEVVAHIEASYVQYWFLPVDNAVSPCIHGIFINAIKLKKNCIYTIVTGNRLFMPKVAILH